MKNKAFTLVELLCVIVILAVISLIIFPNIGEIIGTSKTSLKEVQINDIEKAAEKWATDNPDLLDKYHLNVSYLALNDIQRLGYLETDDVIDPVTQEKMKGCIQIKYDQSIKQYQFEYYDDCEAIILKTSREESLGYIQYKYEDKQLIIDTENSNQFLPAGLEIVNNNVNNDTICSDGETTPGLYDIGNEYVFRGSGVNNYISLSNGTSTTKWRIISIDKDDYSIKAISTSSNPGNFDDNASIKFSEASSKEALIDKANVLKVNENAVWPVPVISDIAMSVSELTSVFSANLSINPSKEDANKPIYSKVGLVTVKDYVNASTDATCSSNFKAKECINNNYLKDMFKDANIWTMTNDGNQIWSILTDGTLTLSSPTESKSLYPVIYLNSNVYVESNDTSIGSDIAPFILK